MSSVDVVIVDSGGANLASLGFALDRLGARGTVSSDARTIASAAYVMLPGVGAAADAMSRLHDLQLVDCLRSLQQPLLGICLGMQLLFTHSAEGNTDCLGIMDGSVQRLQGAPDRPVPHMGWNCCRQLGADPLLMSLGERDYFYFVHGYAAAITPDTTAVTDYGVPFSAVVSHANFHGVQFHPERSGSAGARVLANFLAL
ncbi:MAG: imidazole glycerol phosphate synthase subunit HisH [Steroidobacteraceae bacterium]